MLTERETEQLLEQLLQSQKMEVVGRLAGGVAHDFNNKLQEILGYCDMLSYQDQGSKDLALGFSEMRNAAQGAAMLTQQLLAFARQQPATPQVLDYDDTISSMLKMLRRLIGENIELVWKPCAATGNVLLDPVHADQLLANLAVNARDAIRGVGQVVLETRRIEVANGTYHNLMDCAPGPYIELTFIDNGSGIPQEVLEHIFEPFFTTKAQGHGTGLGLATVYGVVKQNHGLIDVRSVEGSGTSFYVCFQEHLAETTEPGVESTE